MEINTNLLNEPVRSVYYDIYQRLINTLEEEQKYNIAHAALSIEKKDLNNFE